ncbi:MAG TPA: hypothetical protein VKE40_15380 [Gemmataceae bacterium]|nr:hypothetical protein [Gemmataceae bacterium]
MRFRFGLIVVGVAAVLLPGCGGPKMAPVKGRVMFNGQPVKEAYVTFSPMGAPDQLETGKPGTAQTDGNGYFELSTFKEYDGAIVGTHSVQVSLDETNPAKCQRSKGLILEVKPGPNEFTIEMDPK